MLLLGIVTATAAADGNSPFVAAFDRFARHRDIDLLIAGRLLIRELSCTACHTCDDVSLNPKRGPRLDGAGNRLHLNWVAQFLADPGQMKPGTTMPAVLDDLSPQTKAESIRSLVAFLGSLKDPFPEIKGTGSRPVPTEFWTLGQVGQGRQLYHQIGCVACHAPDDTYETVATNPTPLDAALVQLDPEELREAGLLSATRRVESVSLGDPAAKYTRQSLTFFLLDPHRVRPGGRMPDFQLGVIEAADIAAWLLREQSAEAATITLAETTDRSIVSQGRRLFVKVGCANCHSVAGINSLRQATLLKYLKLDSEENCIRSGGYPLPRFSLDGQQLSSIRTALEHFKTHEESSPAWSRLELTMLSLNCLACHERNKHGGVGRYRKAYFETYRNVDIGDEGRLPPPLTGIGRKLKSEWIEKILQGKGNVRGHMRIRMPVFAGEFVKTLPALLADADGGNQPASEQAVFGDQAELMEAGRQLLDIGCVQCHPLRGESLPGVVGIDLDGIGARVQPQWFRDFLLNPEKLKPRTRMPSFFPRGKSQDQTVLHGNAERQIAAMWSYLKRIGNARMPAKLEQARAQNYELTPVDRPLLLRTFMDQAGTHAIAVGFPQQVHFAFDAEQVRLAHAWRGRFLDAQGTWFVRLAPTAQPLGEDAVNLPPGVPFAVLEDPDAVWPAQTLGKSPLAVKPYRFRGYRLDTSGVPTFLYRTDTIDVEDRIEPEGQQLVRQFRLIKRIPTTSSKHVWLRAHQAKILQLTGNASCTSENGLTVSVDECLAQAGAVRSAEDGMEWIIPLSLDKQQLIELRYQW